MTSDMTGEKSTVENNSGDDSHPKHLKQQQSPREKIQQLREAERAKRLAKNNHIRSTGNKLDDLMIKGTVADLEDQTGGMGNTLSTATFYRFILPVIATIFALQILAYYIYSSSMDDLTGSQTPMPVILKVSLIALPICAAALFSFAQLIRTSTRNIWRIFYGTSLIITVVLILASIRTLTLFFLKVLRALRS